MSEKETLLGLNCPRCGGMAPVPEGQVIVKCPYCELRSFVRGERGLLRYQAPLHVDRQGAGSFLQKFLKSNWAIAPAAVRQAQLTEVFLVHLPFWTIWGRVGGWVFGEKQVGSGDHKRYEPREVRVVQDMIWNQSACDVGEFGVNQVPAVERQLQPFKAEDLHATGMVFEPVNSFSEARQAAENTFNSQVQSTAKLDRLAQVFVRTLKQRYALVYHPLWILRYAFRERTFQVVVDGHSGEVLYGKAPGNTLYRAALLVLGMMVGAFLAVDIPSAILYASQDNDVVFFALGSLVVGAAIMFAAYRAFRRGEQYEYRKGGGGLLSSIGDSMSSLEGGMGDLLDIKEVEKWMDQLR